MGETYSRVATQSWFGPGVLATTWIGISLACAVRIKKEQVRPWPLIFLTAALTVLALLPIPREVWLNREVVPLCGVSFLVLLWSVSPGKKFWQALPSLGGMLPLMISSLARDHSEGVSSLEITPKLLVCSSRKMHGEVMRSGDVSYYRTSDGLYFSSSADTMTSVSFDDVFIDGTGRYWSGRALSVVLERWLKEHPYQPPPPAPHRQAATTYSIPDFGQETWAIYPEAYEAARNIETHREKQWTDDSLIVNSISGR